MNPLRMPPKRVPTPQGVQTPQGVFVRVTRNGGVAVATPVAVPVGAHVRVIPGGFPFGVPPFGVPGGIPFGVRVPGGIQVIQAPQAPQPPPQAPQPPPRAPRGLSGYPHVTATDPIPGNPYDITYGGPATVTGKRGLRLVKVRGHAVEDCGLYEDFLRKVQGNHH